MTEETKAPEQEETGIQLGIGDLAGAVQIIDICSKRGAFEGAELEQVGALRARLAAFVQANAPMPEDADAESESEEASE